MEKQLAWEYIKSRKKKNIILLITITLVTAFLMAVSLYGYSCNKMLDNQITSNSGDFQGIIMVNDNNDLKKIEKHEAVKSLGKVITIYNESSDEYNVTYEYNDEKALEYYFLEVVEGIYPKLENEVSIDKLYAHKFNKSIGDTIRVMEKDFKIVGIVDNLTYSREDNKNYRIFMSESFAESLNTKPVGLIQLNNPKNYEFELEEIARVANLSKDSVSENIENVERLMSGAEISQYAMIGALVVLSSFFIIYNIFNIALSERMKTIGLLLTVGVTGKQVRKMVLYEAVFLSLISIPLGAIIGFIATKILISSVYINGDLRLYVQPIIVGVSLLLTLLTVVISSLLPAIKVSKLSPIEASRYVGSVKAPKNKKKRKESKSLFTDLAKVNMWRNKKATIITLVSMILSITLFILAATIIKSLSIENAVNASYITNVQVDLDWRSIVKGEYISGEVLDRIQNVKGAEKTIGLKVITRDKEAESLSPIMGITDNIIEKSKGKIKEGNIDVDEFKKGQSVILMPIDGQTQYKVGDYIEYKNKDGNIQKLKLMAIANEALVSLLQAPETMYVYNESDIFGDNPEYMKILVDTSRERCEEISDKIAPIVESYKNLKGPDNYEDGYGALKKEKQGIEIVGYVIVAVIGLLGIMNFINSTISSIMSRRKELGMLRAVGITDNEISKTLIKEGVYLGSIALSFGIIIGNILGLSIVEFIRVVKNVSFVTYTFPMVETILCIIVIMFILVLTSRLAVNKITKVSVVEQIKFED